MTLTFGWPPAVLSPNARVHWSKRAKAAKSYRAACWAIAMEAGVRQREWHRPKVHLEFVPPDRRRRDWDNMLASCKNGLDGLADAMQTNDFLFRLSVTKSDEIGGMVRVTIEENP